MCAFDGTTEKYEILTAKPKFTANGIGYCEQIFVY